MRNKLLSAVAESLAAGICVVPPVQSGTKAPLAEYDFDAKKMSWEKWQSKLSTQDDHKRWYDDGTLTGIGWVCGKVSGNLEILDFDSHQIYVDYKEHAIRSGLGDLLDTVETGYSERTPNGFHLAYRCATISGNKKLAMIRLDNDSLKSAIETRGEGGYVIVAPSYGTVNKNGIYELCSGSISTIANISAEEREELHRLAQSFDQAPPEPAAQVSSYGIGDCGRPGDEFSKRTSWGDILEPHGWRLIRERGGTCHWRRPDKQWGISATTNHDGNDSLYVFSSNAWPFAQGKSHTKFWAYALLEHSGNIKAATRALANDYSFDGMAGIDVSKICAATSAKKDEPTPTAQQEKSEFPPRLLHPPGLVGELANWIVETAHKRQPVLAIGAAFSAMATIIGRKAYLQGGLHPNIYIVGTGHPGCGKERCREAIRELYLAIGAERKVAFDDFASGSALMQAIEGTPAMLLMIDEIGNFLKSAAFDASGHKNGIIDVLTKVYGRSGSFHIGTAYAKKKDGSFEKPTMVKHPCVSLFGTTIPGSLYRGITSAKAADGFLSRILVLDGEKLYPKTTYPRSKIIPPVLVEGFRSWEEYFPVRSSSDLDTTPIEVKMDQDAIAALMAFDDRLTEHQNSLLLAGDQYQGIYARCPTSARKLALLLACSRSWPPAVPKVNLSDAMYAMEFAKYSTDLFYSGVKANASENKHHEILLRIKQLLKINKNGLSKNQISKKLEHVTLDQRDQALKSLLESGTIAMELKSGKGRPSTHFRLTDGTGESNTPQQPTA